jgi:DNA-binding transcriptional LysR family regulator
MLNFRQIEVFRAIMIANTISGAARMLHTTQPGLSRILHNTEQRLGILLFERKKGRLIPTPEGIHLFEEVQLVYKQIKNLDWSVDQLIQGKDQVLRVGSSPSVGRTLVPNVLRSIKEEMPELKVDFTILTVNQLVDYVSLQMGELAISLFPPNHPSIEQKLLTTGELVAVFPASHELAAKDVIEAADFQDQPIISFDKDTAHGREIVKFFDSVDFEPEISAYVRFAESACALVESGFGIALVDEFTVMGNAFPGLIVRPLKSPSQFHSYLLRHSGIPLSNAGRVFCQHLDQAVADWGKTKLS